MLQGLYRDEEDVYEGEELEGGGMRGWVACEFFDCLEGGLRLLAGEILL